MKIKPGIRLGVRPPAVKTASVAPVPPRENFASSEDWSSLAGKAGVDAVVARYGLKPPSRPLQRFLNPLAFIDGIVRSSNDPHQVAAALITHDARREVFRLEALLRLYGKDLGEAGPPLRARVKQLEDLIGAVTAFESSRKRARKAGAPTLVTDRILALETASRAAVVALVKEQWMPRPDGKSSAVAQLALGLAGHRFGNVADDRAAIAIKIAKQIKKLRDLDLPMNALEPGVHKLRRQLRWIALSMEATDGLVQSTAPRSPNPHYAALMKDAAAVKAFIGAGLPAAVKGERPIEVPSDLYFGLQKAIAELGDVKDDVEAFALISSAYQELGRSPAETARLLGPKGTPTDMETRATVIRDGLTQAKLLKGLQKAFEEAAGTRR